MKVPGEPSSSEFAGHPIRLRYFNRDGTLGELCGNATLCSTNFAILAGLSAPNRVLLDTDAGRVSARLADGTPEIDIAPVDHVLEELPAIALTGQEQRVGFALVGVPHVVMLTDALSDVNVFERGRSIRQDVSLQPAGANVNWVSKLADGRWAYRTYERGVEDETLACGTGAIAAAILLTSWGLASGPVELVTHSGRPVRATFADDSASPTTHPSKGGDSGAAWHPSLRGEGRVVFRGRIEALG
jgi:diaminopimelate epimerase